MRKLSVLGAVVLSLAAVTSVFAATPAVSNAPATSSATAATAATATQHTVPAAHHWAATFKQEKLHGRARLFASSGYRFGRLGVQAWGLTRGSKVEVTIVATSASGSTTLLDVTRTVRAHSGRIAFSVRLDTKVTRAIEAAVAAKDTLTIVVTSVTTSATGTFAPARG